MSTRRSLTPVVLAGALILGALGVFRFGCRAGGRPGVAPKHVLLLTAERVRGDHVTWLGYSRHTTGLLRLDQPYVLDLDWVAKSGVTFPRAFAPGSDDEAALVSLMNGTWPATEGALALSAAGGSEPSTLAEAFRAEGFETGGFFNSRSISAENASADGFGRGFDQATFAATDELVLTAAIEWLGSREHGNTTLFTWVHLAGIDKPFAGPPHEDQLSAADYAGPVRAEADFFDALQRGEVELDARDRQRLNDLYDGRLTRLNELFNSFFFLYKTGFAGGTLWDDTLMVFAGTSGCELAESAGRVATRDSLVDAGLHVPVFLSHQRSLTGERILGTVVELVDVHATLRDWFHLGSSDESSGRSLLCLTDSYVRREFPRYPALSIRRSAGEITGATLRTERWRLIVEGERVRLFDLDVDPFGRRDVSSSFPQELAQLQESLEVRLRELRLSTGAP